MDIDRQPHPTQIVPSGLRPARSFDDACTMVVDYLQENFPMGMWAVTRVVDGRQIFLETRSPTYGIHPGADLSFEDSFCVEMATGRSPRVAGDVSAVPAYREIAAALPFEIDSYVGTPIVRPDGELFGTVCGFDDKVHDDSLDRLEPMLNLLSSLLSAVLEADMTATAVARELEKSRLDAETDIMTGLLNRRGWDRILRLEEDRFRKFGDPASVVVLDLDRLKEVNDTAGHDAGDRYIQRAASVLTAAVRAGDIVARLGGDEFGVVLMGVLPHQVGVLVARMEHALDDAGVAGSFGHAPYSVVAGFPGALRAADEAMYRTKRSRRAGAGRT